MKPVKFENNGPLVMMLGLVLLLLLVLLAGCSIRGEAREELVELQLGPYKLEAPRKNDMSSSIPDWLLSLPGLDDSSRDALFRFDFHEIQARIPEYQYGGVRFRDDIEIWVAALTPEEIKAYQNPETFNQLGDLWRAKGSYRDRKVEPHQSINGLYKVYRDFEYPGVWTLLDRYPDQELPLPELTSDFLVANCRMTGPKDDSQPSCLTFFLLDDIYIQFRMIGYNLKLIKEVKNLLGDMVKGWIKNKD